MPVSANSWQTWTRGLFFTFVWPMPINPQWNTLKYVSNRLSTKIAIYLYGVQK